MLRSGPLHEYYGQFAPKFLDADSDTMAPTPVCNSS